MTAITATSSRNCFTSNRPVCAFVNLWAALAVENQFSRPALHLCAETNAFALSCQYDSDNTEQGAPTSVTALGLLAHLGRDGSVPQGRFGLLSFFSRAVRRFSWAPGRLGLKLRALRYSLTAPFRSPLAASAW